MRYMIIFGMLLVVYTASAQAGRLLKREAAEPIDPKENDKELGKPEDGQFMYIVAIFVDPETHRPQVLTEEIPLADEIEEALMQEPPAAKERERRYAGYHRYYGHNYR